MKRSGQFINFEEDHHDFIEHASIEEVSFQKREAFATVELP
jgi:hypothetical protein